MLKMYFSIAKSCYFTRRVLSKGQYIANPQNMWREIPKNQYYIYIRIALLPPKWIVQWPLFEKFQVHILALSP